MNDAKQKRGGHVIKVTQWDGYVRQGPGAATTAVPIVEVDAHGGHVLEPEKKRVPIGPDHILYPIMISLASFPILMGASGHHLADDLPEDETHPFFPDHFWPYPVIMLAILMAVGIMSAFIGANMHLEQSANPETVVDPRPDWYFLFLFQFLKLGGLLPLSSVWFSQVIPGVVGGALLLWPFIDQMLGSRVARVLGWDDWPKPGRNVITGTIWILLLMFLVVLTFWAISGLGLFGITPT